MYEHNPLQNDARRKARQKQLGVDAVCVLCQHARWEALIPVRRNLLEAHHVLGRVHAPSATVPLCRNCHAKMTEQLRQVGASMKGEGTPLDRLVSVLRALALFFLELAPTLLDAAGKIDGLIAALDRTYPNWRKMPEAK